MLEKQIEKYLVDKVKELGGIAYKFTSPARRGVPDRICVLQHVVAFVEVKCEKGVLSALQKAEIQRLRSLHANVFVVWSKEDIDNLLAILKEIGDEQLRKNG